MAADTLKKCSLTNPQQSKYRCLNKHAYTQQNWRFDHFSGQK